jgi:hypothetical protein
LNACYTTIHQQRKHTDDHMFIYRVHYIHSGITERPYSKLNNLQMLITNQRTSSHSQTKGLQSHVLAKPLSWLIHSDVC